MPSHTYLSRLQLVSICLASSEKAYFSRSVDSLNPIVHRQALAGPRPIKRALHEIGHDRNHIVDGADQLFGRVAFAVDV